MSETVSAFSDLLNDLPVSAKQVAAKAEEMEIHLPYGTLTGYWAGNHGKPSKSTLEKLALVLAEIAPAATESRLQRAAWGRSAPLGLYEPPEESIHLTERQRRAIDELIKSVTSLDEPQAPVVNDPIGDEFIRSASEVDDVNNRANEAG